MSTVFALLSSHCLKFPIHVKAKCIIQNLTQLRHPLKRLTLRGAMDLQRNEDNKGHLFVPIAAKWLTSGSDDDATTTTTVTTMMMMIDV